MKWISHISSFIIIICSRVQQAITICKVVKSNIKTSIHCILGLQNTRTEGQTIVEITWFSVYITYISEVKFYVPSMMVMILHFIFFCILRHCLCQSCLCYWTGNGSAVGFFYTFCYCRNSDFSYRVHPFYTKKPCPTPISQAWGRPNNRLSISP